MCLTRNTRGFTLVELLVVIGIIVLVVGVSLPAISIFMRGKSLEGSVQTIQTAFMMAKQATVTQKVRHRILFFKRVENGQTLYGVVLYRCSSPYDPPKGKKGETAGGFGEKRVLARGIVPQLYYANPSARNDPPTPPMPKNNLVPLPAETDLKENRIQDGHDGIQQVAGQTGKLEFLPQGTILFGGNFGDILSFDPEHLLKDGDLAPDQAHQNLTPAQHKAQHRSAPQQNLLPADIILLQQASRKVGYIDIMPLVGRLYTRVLYKK